MKPLEKELYLCPVILNKWRLIVPRTNLQGTVLTGLRQLLNPLPQEQTTPALPLLKPPLIIMNFRFPRLALMKVRYRLVMMLLRVGNWVNQRNNRRRGADPLFHI